MKTLVSFHPAILLTHPSHTPTISSLTAAQIEKLERIDFVFFRKLFKVTSSCPKESFYLETGAVPMNIIITSRRLNYLHHLATRSSEEMLYKVFRSQWRNSCRNDWTEQIRKDLDTFGLNADLDWVTSMTKLKYKNLFKLKSKEVALNQLIEQKKMHSKMNNLNYSELSIQSYLKTKNISVRQAQTNPIHNNTVLIAR